MPEDHTGMKSPRCSDSNTELDATKLVVLTTDSGSNIVLACELLNW